MQLQRNQIFDAIVTTINQSVLVKSYINIKQCHNSTTLNLYRVQLKNVRQKTFLRNNLLFCYNYLQG